LVQGSPETAERYWEARRAAASAVAEAKTRVWEEFKEAMEKDFWLASRKFWQTVWQLSKGNQGLAQALSGRRTADPDPGILLGCGKSTLRNS